MAIRKPAVLGAGLPCHASLPASDSLVIIGNNTSVNYRSAFSKHGFCVALGSLKPTPHFRAFDNLFFFHILLSVGFLLY